MERSDSLIKLIAVIVFAALVVYMGNALYQSTDNSLKTVLAVETELNTSVQTEGYAVRYEETVSTSGSSVSVSVMEGERVSAGEELAVAYSGDSALQRAETIRELTIQIEQMESMLNGTIRTQAAKDSIQSLSAAVASGDLSGIDAILLDVETYITEAEEIDLSSIEAQLPGLRTRLESLKSASSGTSVVTAEHAGTFSSHTDGYESISPDDITTGILPDEVRKLFETPSAVSSSCFGKLVSGIRWYYVTIMDTKSASKLSGMSSVNVEFSRTYSGTISMTVENIGPVSDDGECVVLLSCSKYLQDVVAIRDMTAEIIFSATTGIQVPREAMHIDDDGQTYVYILKGLTAERVNVEILGEKDDSYVVEKTGTGLRSGDEIITRAKTLFDGAVVAK